MLLVFFSVLFILNAFILWPKWFQESSKNGANNNYHTIRIIKKKKERNRLPKQNWNRKKMLSIIFVRVQTNLNRWLCGATKNQFFVFRYISLFFFSFCSTKNQKRINDKIESHAVIYKICFTKWHTFKAWK